MASWVNIMDIFYPVGAFYISNKNTSPSSLFGGTWSQVTNAAIRGVASSAKAEYTGSDSTTLTTSQIPSHNHYVNVNYAFAGWTGSSPGAYMTLDPVDWFDGYGGTWNNRNGATDNTPFIRNTGGGGSHTNIQRSYNCYVWFRTA